jgi:hypothetical protein
MIIIRGLRARLLATIPTDSTDRGDQDRHLMSALVHRPSSGHRRMWPTTTFARHRTRLAAPLALDDRHPPHS